MCGLAGFARQPDAPGLKKVVKIHKRLMLAAEKRGKHATGFAVLGIEESFIRKWAISMSGIVNSGIYERQVASAIPDDVTYMIGHTRYATLPNKHDDDAAHPFAFSKTIGCHNGSITNWRELQRDNQQDGWVTDSQAALWAIDVERDPRTALKKLDGWWALAWVKGGVLSLTRTEEKPLSVAYVPKLKTLFWASEREALERALKKAKVKGTVWGLTEDTIYEFRPADFGDDANSKERPVVLDRPTAKLKKQNEEAAAKKLGPVEQTSMDWSKGKRTWVDDLTDGVDDRPRTLAQFMREVDSELQSMRDKIAKLSEEQDFLYDVIEAEGLLGGSQVSCHHCSDGAEGGKLVYQGEGIFVHPECALG